MTAPAIDFLQQRPIPVLGSSLLALGAAALVVALAVDRHQAQARAAHQAALQSLAAEAEQRRRDTDRPPVLSPDQRRLQQVAPQLRQPWLPVLRVVEGATRPPVHLLALAIDPASGAVRIEGEAPGFDKALEYAKSLDQDGLLGPAELRSHEQVADDSGRTAVRFTIVTRWSAR